MYQHFVSFFYSFTLKYLKDMLDQKSSLTSLSIVPPLPTSVYGSSPISTKRTVDWWHYPTSTHLSGLQNNPKHIDNLPDHSLQHIERTHHGLCKNHAILMKFESFEVDECCRYEPFFLSRGWFFPTICRAADRFRGIPEPTRLTSVVFRRPGGRITNDSWRSHIRIYM